MSVCVSQLGTNWSLLEFLDLILSAHKFPSFFESCMWVKIILDEILSEALIIGQAVEIRIESTLICCHKREKLRVDQLFLDVNCDFVREYLLQIATDRI